MEEKQTITFREIWQIKSARPGLISSAVILIEFIVAPFFPNLEYIFFGITLVAGIVAFVSVRMMAKQTPKG